MVFGRIRDYPVKIKYDGLKRVLVHKAALLPKYRSIDKGLGECITESLCLHFLLVPQLLACHSRAGGNPLRLGRWIPAFAGKTTSLVAGFLQT
jgi:hypothetical protein